MFQSLHQLDMLNISQDLPRQSFTWFPKTGAKWSLVISRCFSLVGYHIQCLFVCLLGFFVVFKEELPPRPFSHLDTSGKLKCCQSHLLPGLGLHMFYVMWLCLPMFMSWNLITKGMTWWSGALKRWLSNEGSRGVVGETLDSCIFINSDILNLLHTKWDFKNYA